MPQTDLDIRVRGHDQVSRPLKLIQSSIIRFVGAVTASVAAINAIAFPVRAAAEFERELANVRKTTNFTATAMQGLSNDLINLSRNLDASATDLAKIAAIAGQLGLGSQGAKSIAAFTETTSRFATVLDVSVEAAAEGLAKISNIFKISLNEAERISSAFNEVSNNSTASGEQLLDVVRRLGDAGGILSLQESLALAATAIDFGVSNEVAATAFQKTLVQMQARAADFAQFMGVSTEEWVNRLRESGIGALQDVLEKLNQIDAVTAATLKGKLFAGGTRNFGLLNKLQADAANNFAVLSKNLRFATEGYEEGTSSIQEQATILETLTAQIQILKNNFTALGIEIGNRSLPGLVNFTKSLSEFFKDPNVKDGFIRISETLETLLSTLTKAGRAIVNLGVNWENLISILGLFVASKIIFRILEMASAAGTAALSLNTLTLGLPTLAGNVKGVGAAFREARLAVTGFIDEQKKIAASKIVEGSLLGQTLRQVQADKQAAIARNILREKDTQFELASIQKRLNSAKKATRERLLVEQAAIQERLKADTAAHGLRLKMYDREIKMLQGQIAYQKTAQAASLPLLVGLGNFGKVVGTATTAIAKFGSVVFTLIRSLTSFGLTLLFVTTILDSFGLLKPITDQFFRLLEVIGLYSKEKQEQARADRIARREMLEHQREVHALARAYDDLRESNEDALKAASIIDAFNKNIKLGSAGISDTEKLITDLARAAELTAAKLEDTSRQYINSKDDLNEYARSVFDLTNSLAENEKQIEQLEARLLDQQNKRVSPNAIGRAVTDTSRKEMERQLSDLRLQRQALLSDIENQRQNQALLANTIQKTLLPDITGSLNGLVELGNEFRAIFFDTTLEKDLPAIVALKNLQDQLQANREELAKLSSKDRDAQLQETEDQKNQVEELQQEIRSKEKDIIEIEGQIRQKQEELSGRNISLKQKDIEQSLLQKTTYEQLITIQNAVGASSRKMGEDFKSSLDTKAIQDYNRQALGLSLQRQVLERIRAGQEELATATTKAAKNAKDAWQDAFDNIEKKLLVIKRSTADALQQFDAAVAKSKLDLRLEKQKVRDQQSIDALSEEIDADINKRIEKEKSYFEERIEIARQSNRKQAVEELELKQRTAVRALEIERQNRKRSVDEGFEVKALREQQRLLDQERNDLVLQALSSVSEVVGAADTGNLDIFEDVLSRAQAMTERLKNTTSDFIDVAGEVAGRTGRDGIARKEVQDASAIIADIEERLLSAELKGKQIVKEASERQNEQAQTSLKETEQNIQDITERLSQLPTAILDVLPNVDLFVAKFIQGKQELQEIVLLFERLASFDPDQFRRTLGAPIPTAGEISNLLSSSVQELTSGETDIFSLPDESDFRDQVQQFAEIWSNETGKRMTITPSVDTISIDEELGNYFRDNVYEVQIRPFINDNGKITFPDSDTIPGRAKGGFIKGSGTGTSDSILSWLSNGEYVMDANTTKKFGPAFFRALQTIANSGGSLSGFKFGLPAFAAGGLAVGSSINGSMQPINLTIPEVGTFSVLAESDTADSLARAVRILALKRGTPK